MKPNEIIRKIIKLILGEGINGDIVCVLRKQNPMPSRLYTESGYYQNTEKLSNDIIKIIPENCIKFSAYYSVEDSKIIIFYSIPETETHFEKEEKIEVLIHKLIK